MSDESQKEGKLAPGRDKEPASYSAESTRRPDVLGTQIEAGISFQTTDNEAPWWHALDPHGTQMAHIICSIDPLCRLFISRLAEPKRSEAFADSVAKAIHWAVDQNVDIISLGHVVYTEPGSVTAKKIKTAVQRARDHDIVILSSSDQQARGAWDIFRIPHIRHEIFTIAPCNHSGELAKWYKSPWYNYCFVDNVDFDGALFLGSSQVVSGSSVSTAIATGVISLILVFCRLANENNFEPDDKWRTSITKTKLDAMCDGEGTAADDRFVVLDNICGGKKLEDVDFMTEVRNSFRYQRPRPAYSESGEEDDTWNE
ncbi:peptidase S8/S53 domain-containing protein [Nemania abortiva]|nr:peptidase S8/S53 domain-containing protein [Nemania abortiva]